VKKKKVIPQVIRMGRNDCMDNEIDWELLRGMIRNGTGGAPSTEA